jgi:hypothetical protein
MKETKPLAQQITKMTRHAYDYQLKCILVILNAVPEKQEQGDGKYVDMLPERCSW